MPIYPLKKFEDCLEKVTYTSKIQRKDFLESGYFPIISQEMEQVNGYWENEKDVFKIKKPVVIFGDHTQVIKYVDFNFVLGADGVKILQPKDFLNTRYFYYFLQSVELKSLGYARHYRLLKDLEIPLPPLSAQEEIVAKLDTALASIDEARTKTEQNLKNTREIFYNYLHKIVTNKENGWEEKKLKDVAEYFNGLTYSPKNVSDEGIIVLRSSNVQNDKLDFSDLVRVNLNVKEKIIVKDGDILMCSRNGSKRLVGKTATIRNLPEKMTFGTFMMIVRSQYNPYLGWFFKSNDFRKQISGGENPMINQITRYMLDEIVISFPPVEIQDEIVKKLDNLFSETKKLEILYQNKLNYLDELRRSVLQEAFVQDFASLSYFHLLNRTN
ncbi:restriction endonuclease subunit S [Candidatus Gracilibacteria bacterium]|nr:restriction endonuclease subunit S [Candidatus Gracilibacteria bacterium]